MSVDDIVTWDGCRRCRYSLIRSEEGDHRAVWVKTEETVIRDCHVSGNGPGRGHEFMIRAHSYG
jgi:hypothetical protein